MQTLHSGQEEINKVLIRVYSQEETCNITIDENVEVEYKSSIKEFDNWDLDPDYIAQN